MIRSFADRRTSALFEGFVIKGVDPRIVARARRSLRQIHNVRSLDQLRLPPGNRLEALKGDRAGQHSIRVNDQWRICFVWRGSDAFDVELVDYH